MRRELRLTEDQKEEIRIAVSARKFEVWTVICEAQGLDPLTVKGYLNPSTGDMSFDAEESCMAQDARETPALSDLQRIEEVGEAAAGEIDRWRVENEILVVIKHSNGEASIKAQHVETTDKTDWRDVSSDTAEIANRIAHLKNRLAQIEDLDPRGAPSQIGKKPIVIRKERIDPDTLEVLAVSFYACGYTRRSVEEAAQDARLMGYLEGRES